MEIISGYLFKKRIVLSEHKENYERSEHQVEKITTINVI